MNNLNCRETVLNARGKSVQRYLMTDKELDNEVYNTQLTTLIRLAFKTSK